MGSKLGKKRVKKPKQNTTTNPVMITWPQMCPPPLPSSSTTLRLNNPFRDMQLANHQSNRPSSHEQTKSLIDIESTNSPQLDRYYFPCNSCSHDDLSSTNRHHERLSRNRHISVSSSLSSLLI